MRTLAIALLLTVSLPQESKYRITDLGAGRKVEYLVVAADPLADSCDALLAHREKGGRKVGLVTYSQACAGAKEAGPDALVAFLKGVTEKWGLKYVLLVGDAIGEAAIPMKVEAGKYFTEKFASEKELATDWIYTTLGGADPVLHVGRFPADTKDELKVMIVKTIAYETAQKPGPWQRKISFITGEGGFGPMVDAMLESQFTRIVSDNIPAEYDVEVAYAQISSKYCPFPPKFNDNAVRLLNEGSLFYVYVGHGWREGCDQILWKGKPYDILSSKNAEQIDIQNGLPVMVVIACSTGFADAKSGDCFGEVVMKRKSGPVAFLGGSRVTQPYGNALLGRELVITVFDGKSTTFGEALDEAKKRILAPDDSAFRKAADQMAGTVQGKDALEGMRSDVVRHYNLFGDPAVVLQKAAGVIKLETLGVEAPGKKLTVRGKAPFAEGKVVLSFECPRDKLTKPLEKLPKASAPEYADKMIERYKAANDKAYVRVEFDLKDGAFEKEITLPEGLANGAYALKAFAWNGAASAGGAKAVTIAE